MFWVATFNVNYDVEAFGFQGIRRQLIAQVIKETQPDVIALPAVAQLFGSIDRAAKLAGLVLHYHHNIFQRTNQRPDGTTLGSARLSREPLNDLKVLTLATEPGNAGGVQRLVHVSCLEYNFGPANLFYCASFLVIRIVKRTRTAHCPIHRIVPQHITIGRRLSCVPGEHSAGAAAAGRGW